jgi:hypothetical protein
MGSLNKLDVQRIKHLLNDFYAANLIFGVDDPNLMWH